MKSKSMSTFDLLDRWEIRVRSTVLKNWRRADPYAVLQSMHLYSVSVESLVIVCKELQ